ncbi:hypothetical protein [Streptomyces sp. CBMA123]|uniref:hypothetical protein n=1 Tax=Streptomyces sp. CBMA123 TaxID=1896313 RepID=UPI0016620625|nr:hypothetical protein [Streptomyces sp. CBMA123]MBD0690263.1 hypothetical protein [Streptomyces sp. CBMA123]
MAPPTPPRPRRAAVPATALAVLAALTALGVLAFGRPAPGGLRDDGPRQAVAPPSPSPSAKPLWPGLATAPPPATSSTDSAAQAPPQPVPDVTVPGHDLTAADVRTLLAKDPGVSAEERRALESCTECEARAPEFRDLTGDGRPELIAAVATPGPVVLHVYTLADDRVLPILRVQVLQRFSAATIDCDLWLYEPTTYTTRTTRHYRWDGSRLALIEKKVEGVGLLPPADPSADPTSGAGTAQVPFPARPTAGPKQPPAAGVPFPYPSRATAQPSGPAVAPEAKR